MSGARRAYVSQRDLADGKTDVWFLPMGSGKTHGMLEIIHDTPGKQVLVITCRKTLGSDIFGRSRQSGIVPVQCLEVANKKELAKADLLMIQGESRIRHIRNAKPYDFVFIDEWESFTNIWLSHKTRNTHLRRNLDSFVSLWEGSKKVLLMDAFIITQKIVKFLEATGDDYRVLGSRHMNTDRTINYIDFESNRRSCCVNNDSRIFNTIDVILNDMRADKNIVVFYPYSDKSEMAFVNFHDTIVRVAGLSE